jgi:hypothetical protein
VNAARCLRRLVPLSALVVLLGATVAMVAPLAARASPAASLTCHASMSNAHPADYGTTYVMVSTVGGAAVSTVAHYKSKETNHSATANSAGKAVIAYKISRATPNFRVIVSVKVSKNGRSGSCSTSFTPV